MKNWLILLLLISSLAYAKDSHTRVFSIFVDIDTGESINAADEANQIRGKTFWNKGEKCKLITEYKITSENSDFSADPNKPITVKGNRINLYSLDRLTNLYSTQFIVFTGKSELINEMNDATNSCEHLLEFITDRHLWELRNPNIEYNPKKEALKHKLKMYYYQSTHNPLLSIDSRRCYIQLRGDRMPHKINLIQYSNDKEIILDSAEVTREFIDKNANEIIMSTSIASSCPVLKRWMYELIDISK